MNNYKKNYNAKIKLITKISIYNNENIINDYNQGAASLNFKA